MNALARLLSAAACAALSGGAACAAAEADFLPIRFHGAPAAGAGADTDLIRFHQMDLIDPTEAARSREIYSRDLPIQGNSGAQRANAPPAPGEPTYLLPPAPKAGVTDRRPGTSRKDDSPAGARRDARLGGSDGAPSDSGSGWGWLADSVYDSRSAAPDDASRRVSRTADDRRGAAGLDADSGLSGWSPIAGGADAPEWSSVRIPKEGGDGGRPSFGVSERLDGSSTRRSDAGTRRVNGGGFSSIGPALSPVPAPAPPPLTKSPSIAGGGLLVRPPPAPQADALRPSPVSRTGGRSGSPFDRKSPFDR